MSPFKIYKIGCLSVIGTDDGVKLIFKSKLLIFFEHYNMIDFKNEDLFAFIKISKNFTDKKLRNN